MKIYQRHNCERRHRKWSAVAKCIWPRAYWVHGEGRFASVAWCRVLTIWLHDEADDAMSAKAFIDKYGCGGKCVRRHEVVELSDGLI